MKNNGQFGDIFSKDYHPTCGTIDFAILFLNLPFHTVHGVLKARILKWFAIPFSSEKAKRYNTLK